MARDTSKYEVDGVRLLSVTEVLGIIEVVNLNFVDAEFLKQRAFEGNEVHEYTELVDDGLIDPYEIDTGNRSIDNCMVAYGDFLASDEGKKFEWKDSEIAVASARLGFAGTVDRIGTRAGMPCIMDFKTATQKSKSWGLQLSAYALLAAEHYEDPRWRVAERWSLRVRQDGKFKLDRFDKVEELMAFEAMAHTARFLVDNGYKKAPWGK